jgi:hypothetical protein
MQRQRVEALFLFLIPPESTTGGAGVFGLLATKEVDDSWAKINAVDSGGPPEELWHKTGRIAASLGFIVQNLAGRGIVPTNPENLQRSQHEA